MTTMTIVNGAVARKGLKILAMRIGGKALGSALKGLGGILIAYEIYNMFGANYDKVTNFVLCCHMIKDSWLSKL